MKRSECKLIERNRDHYFEVYEAPSGEWYLEALVGGSGMYSVTLRMTAQEIAAYQDDPSIARELTYRLAKGDPELKSREVPNLEG